MTVLKFNPLPETRLVAEIDLLLVDSGVRRRGLGTWILANAQKVLRKKAVSHILINVVKTNESAIRFWKKNGFQPLSESEYTQSNGVEESTVYMMKKI
jgi:ribosomal protein S18 acetylase RimI-like enzyme